MDYDALDKRTNDSEGKPKDSEESPGLRDKKKSVCVFDYNPHHDERMVRVMRID